MKKIPTLFVRDEQNRKLVTDQVSPGCEWVASGEGVATKKYDGICCMIRDGKFYRRFTLQTPGYVDERGRAKKPQSHPQFEAATELDTTTGKQEGWVPVGDGPEDQYFREAFAQGGSIAKEPVGDTVPFADGTYELIGEKVQGNPENLMGGHWLIRHANADVLDAPRTFDGLKEWFIGKDLEGIVFHHPDGKMAKIKKRDFGMKRKA